MGNFFILLRFFKEKIVCLIFLWIHVLLLSKTFSLPDQRTVFFSTAFRDFTLSALLKCLVELMRPLDWDFKIFFQVYCLKTSYLIFRFKRQVRKCTLHLNVCLILWDLGVRSRFFTSTFHRSLWHCIFHIGDPCLLLCLWYVIYCWWYYQ